jgi:hypothetical protein
LNERTIKMIFENMISELFMRFPTLKAIYDKEGGYIENLQHPCFSIVFVPYIRNNIVENNIGVMQLICSFMELMALSEDKLVSELLAVSVLEPMLSEREMIEKLKIYSGKATLKLLSKMEKANGWS